MIRNRRAKAEGDLVRERIRSALIERGPLATPRTAKQLKAHLGLQLEERTISWHVREIRREADAQADYVADAAIHPSLEAPQY